MANVWTVTDEDGDWERTYATHPPGTDDVWASDAQDAAQMWAEWICAQEAEYPEERVAMAARRVVTVCAEHGDELSSTWEDDDGDLLVKVEPCSRCTQDAFGAGHARATGRHL